MEIILRSSAATIASSQSFFFSNSLAQPKVFSSKVFLCHQFRVKRSCYRVSCLLQPPEEESRTGSFPSDRSSSRNADLQLNKKLLLLSTTLIDLSALKPERIRRLVPSFSHRVVVGVMVVMMALGFTVTKAPSWALSEENLLFLEAWRTLDRAYVDKTFNGQSWFRYRENALRSEPMTTREETYAAIKKMVATLDDPFTRFLEPQKFKSLRAVGDKKYTDWSRNIDWVPFCKGQVYPWARGGFSCAGRSCI